MARQALPGQSYGTDPVPKSAGTSYGASVPRKASRGGGGGFWGRLGSEVGKDLKSEARWAGEAARGVGKVYGAEARGLKRGARALGGSFMQGYRGGGGRKAKRSTGRKARR